MPYITYDPDDGRYFHVSLSTFIEDVERHTRDQEKEAPPMRDANPTLPPEHVLQALRQPRRLQLRVLREKAERRTQDPLWVLLHGRRR